MSTKRKIIEDYVKRGKSIRDNVPVNIAYDDESTPPNQRQHKDLRIKIKKGALQVYNIKRDRQKRVLASITLCIFKQLSEIAKLNRSIINLHEIQVKQNGDDKSHSIYAIISTNKIHELENQKR